LLSNQLIRTVYQCLQARRRRSVFSSLVIVVVVVVVVVIVVRLVVVTTETEVSLNYKAIGIVHETGQMHFRHHKRQQRTNILVSDAPFDSEHGKCGLLRSFRTQMRDHCSHVVHFVTFYCLRVACRCAKQQPYWYLVILFTKNSESLPENIAG